MRALRLLVLCTLSLSACSTFSRGTALPPPPSPESAAGTPSTADRLLIRQAWLELETDRPVDAGRQVEAIARGVGGYVESSKATDERRVSVVVRVPAVSLDSVLAAYGRLGEVEDTRISGTDVTEETTDLQARLQNLVSVRDRLRQHLARAADVEDVIAVEKELARVQAEVDVLEARLRRLGTDVAMSRVSVEVHRERRLGPLGWLVAGFAWVIEKLFIIE
jgi:hypothetical protein